MALEKLGPYRLEKMLGRGGMGAVYAGENELTGQRAAVKVLAGHLADNADFRERFTAEVETLKKLKHPNIVQLLAWGEEGEHLFYVMELVEGRSLQDELEAGRRFNWREVAKFGVDICRALKHAHDNGVIHRDLKPANLLLDHSDQVKLTDFGIAKLYGGTNITAAGGVLGTADYMSPEQAEGKPVNARSDLYSLGSVLYALLTGRPPFASKSLAEVIHGLRYDKPVDVRRLNPSVPAEFESITLQLLEKDPAKRIASAFAVGNYLRAMEHALSLETQIGIKPPTELTPDPLPVQGGSRSQTAGNFEATMVTPVSLSTPVQSSPAASATGQSDSPRTQDNHGATVDLGNGGAPADYGLMAQVANGAMQSLGIHQSLTQMPSQAAELLVAPKSRFVTREEEEAAHSLRASREDEGNSIWLVIAGLGVLLLLLTGGIVYAMTPATADTLHARITAAVASGNPSAVEAEIQQFLERFPSDARIEDITREQELLEMQRLERQFEIKARFGNIDSYSPLQLAYFNALRVSQSNPEKALLQFQAIVNLFGDAPSDSAAQEKVGNQFVELSRKQIIRLEEVVDNFSDDDKAIIGDRMDEADRIQHTAPEKARAMYQAVLDLYAEKLWAKSFIDRANLGLQAIDGSSSQEKGSQ